MNLEKYKEQMSERFPSGKFTEETLFNLKNGRSKIRVPMEAIAKGTGAAALLTAAAFTIVAGASFFRGVFGTTDDPAQTFNVFVEDVPEQEEPSVTPLANPDHAVRINTENGQVAMDENTTPEEMLACGAVLDQAHGLVGYEQICRLLRAFRHGESAELVVAKISNTMLLEGKDEGQRTYYYVGLNADGTVNGKTYFYKNRESYLETYPFERNGNGALSNRYVKLGNCTACVYCPTDDERLMIHAGMALRLGACGAYLPICTISDLLRVTGYDGETLRERYYTILSHASGLAGVNILYQGKLSAPKQLYYFISQTKDEDVYCCSTTITDLTKTDEYEECFYALEYVGGRFRIFTMKNGFEGEFDTQEFDGFTLENDFLVFRNETTEYRFPYSYEETIGENARIGYQELRDTTNEASQMTPYNIWEISGSTAISSYIGISSNQSAVNLHGSKTKDEEEEAYLIITDPYIPYGNTLYIRSETDRAEKALFQPIGIDQNYFLEWISHPENYLNILDEYSDESTIAVEIKDVEETDQTIWSYTIEGGYVWGTRPYAAFTAEPPTPSGKYRLLSGASFYLPADQCDIREMPDGKTCIMLPRTFPNDRAGLSCSIKTLSITENGDAVRFDLEIEQEWRYVDSAEYLAAHPERITRKE